MLSLRENPVSDLGALSGWKLDPYFVAYLHDDPLGTGFHCPFTSQLGCDLDSPPFPYEGW
jgi:hypothetical protein